MQIHLIHSKSTKNNTDALQRPSAKLKKVLHKLANLYKFLAIDLSLLSGPDPYHGPSSHSPRALIAEAVEVFQKRQRLDFRIARQHMLERGREFLQSGQAVPQAFQRGGVGRRGSNGDLDGGCLSRDCRNDSVGKSVCG